MKTAQPPIPLKHDIFLDPDTMLFSFDGANSNYSSYAAAREARNSTLKAQATIDRLKCDLDCVFYDESDQGITNIRIKGIHYGNGNILTNLKDRRISFNPRFYPNHPTVLKLIGRVMAANRDLAALRKQLARYQLELPRSYGWARSANQPAALDAHRKAVESIMESYQTALSLTETPE
jgi:hypothetical protein